MYSFGLFCASLPYNFKMGNPPPSVPYPASGAASTRQNLIPFPPSTGRMGLTGGPPHPRNLAGQPNFPGNLGHLPGNGSREIPRKFGWPAGEFPGKSPKFLGCPGRISREIPRGSNFAKFHFPGNPTGSNFAKVHFQGNFQGAQYPANSGNGAPIDFR